MRYTSKCYERSFEVIFSHISTPPSGKGEPVLNFNRMVVVFAAMTFVIGIFGLLDWIPGFRVLTGVYSNQFTIAPGSSITFIVFGIILILIVRKQFHERGKIILSTIIGFISIYGLLEFIGYFADINFTFDSLMFSATEKLGPFDVRRMSPLTGILFFFSGVSLQLKVLSRDRLRILYLVGGYGLITLLAGFIAAIGYLFGTPLLYGGTMIPLTVTTAIGFLILGCGLVASAGPKMYFVRPFVGSSASARMLQVLVPLVVIAILVEGYLNEVFGKTFDINQAFLSAVLSLFFAIVTGVLIVQIARAVFRKADKVEIERQRVQRDLEASEIRYRRLFESAKDGILILDAETGTVVEVNPFIIELMGYSRETFLGKVLWEIDLFKDVTASKEVFNQLKRKGYIRYEDLPMETKDGRKINVEFVSNVYRVDGTSVIQCNIRDITDRKRAEESLMLQNAALQSAANAILITDRNGKIISVNKAFIRLTGYSQEEVIGSKPNILKSGNHSAAFFQSMWKTILSGEVWKGEIENKRKDGSLYTEDMTITPVRQARGEISHFIAIKQDITDRKKLEQEILQSQKIQSIGTLAGGIAHDFNNILAIILIYASLLERSEDSSREKILESSRAITRAVGRGKELVRQILTFARKTDVVFEPVSVPDLIHELLSMLKETFPKVITFSESIEENIPFISADRAQIHQVILNLYVNARDAMPQGGTITIKVEKQAKYYVQKTFPAADQDAYICISVTDTGEGIDKAIIPRIFDPFFTTKEMGKGTGLGLAVVYGVLQSHHGFVGVESEQGYGTTFKLYFPIPFVSEEVATVSSLLKSIVVGGTETILLVEDESLLVDSVSNLLKLKGYKVYTSMDGIDAVNIYNEHKQEIDLVITDIGLPGITGKDEFKLLKEINPRVKVVLASGFFEPEMKIELIKEGAKGFIQKPYVPEDILRVIREALDAKVE
jgi:two-component system, cell cycle sensor histidine kinase and response regulator CckA